MQAFSQRYEAALALAARAHRNQTRKGSDVPYLVHPVHVSVLLLRHGLGEEVAIAGLLHDVVEDQGVPLAEIEATFGLAVAEMVAALSEQKKEGGVPRPWEVRKQESLDKLRMASDAALAVKAADVVHNCRGLVWQLQQEGAAIWRHYSRGPQESLWYYRSVAAIVRERLGEQPLTLELDEAVRDLAQAIAEMVG